MMLFPYYYQYTLPNRKSASSKHTLSSTLCCQSQTSSTHSEGENTGRTGEVTSVSQTLQNHFLSLAQPYPNCTQHIQIGTMNVYHGAGPSQPTDHSDCKPVKRRRIIIESDSD